MRYIKELSRVVGLFSLLAVTNSASAINQYFGTALCNHPDFYCAKAPASGWSRAFPDPKQRDIVQRVNRTYNYIPRGKLLAIPRKLDEVTIFDVSPFPLTFESKGEKTIIIDQNKLAWVAYDANGKQVHWGPISSGKDFCPDIGRPCRTITGVFRFFNKENSQCRSRTFGGARMPYCMFFYKGFAMHGSNDIPGRRASHGCIRMFTRDAQWLNHQFVELSHNENGWKGTKVIVREIYESKTTKMRRRNER
jgi:hypothetical protein